MHGEKDTLGLGYSGEPIFLSASAQDVIMVFYYTQEGKICIVKEILVRLWNNQAQSS